MTRTTFTLLLLLMTASLFGQAAFNYHRDFQPVLAKSRDKTSEWFYPKLLARFNSNDTTLTQLDMLALQIGFTASPYYKPYQMTDTEWEMRSLNAKKQYEAAIVVCDSVLRIYPVNFVALLEKSVAYEQLKKDSAAFHRAKLMRLVAANMASGDGTSRNAYFALGPLDGQLMMIRIFQAEVRSIGSGTDPYGNFITILEVKNKENQVLGACFNIQHATQKILSEEAKPKPAAQATGKKKRRK